MRMPNLPNARRAVSRANRRYRRYRIQLRMTPRGRVSVYKDGERVMRACNVSRAIAYAQLLSLPPEQFFAEVDFR